MHKVMRVFQRYAGVSIIGLRSVGINGPNKKKGNKKFSNRPQIPFAAYLSMASTRLYLIPPPSFP